MNTTLFLEVLPLAYCYRPCADIALISHCPSVLNAFLKWAKIFFQIIPAIKLVMAVQKLLSYETDIYI